MSKNYKFEISAKKFWTIVVPLVLLVLILAPLLGFFAVNGVVMPHLVDLSNRNEVVVPALTELTFDDARQRCFDLGLRLVVEGREYNETTPANIVLLQSPESDERVKRGRVIRAIVSDGSEVAVVPPLSDLMPGPAKTDLRAAGFSKIQSVTVYNNSVEKGRVI